MLVLHPGDYASSRDDIVLCTVLGSCISVVLYDKVLGYGGMNHFMLPFSSRSPDVLSEDGKYGVNAMELLINDMMKKGSNRFDLQAKVFGGGHVLHTIPMGASVAKVPENNIAFAMDFLKKEGFPIVSSDVGEDYGRKIFLFTASGKVLLKRLRGHQVEIVVREEDAWGQTLTNVPPKNGVVLFNELQ